MARGPIGPQAILPDEFQKCETRREFDRAWSTQTGRFLGPMTDPPQSKLSSRGGPILVILGGGIAIFVAYAALLTALAWFKPADCHLSMDHPSLDQLAQLYANYQRGGSGLWELVFSAQPSCALPYFKRALALHPKHAEAHLALAMVYAYENETAPAIVHTAAAYVLGEPARLLLETFQLQPSRSLSTTLILDGLTWIAPTILDGPMVRVISPHSADIWVRTRDSAQVTAIAEPSQTPGDPIRSDSVVSTAKDDHVVILQLNGLQADTLYTYWITIDGRRLPSGKTFRSFPEAGTSSAFSVAFGGCSEYIPQNFRIYQTIASRFPVAFLSLGDNAYIDAPTNPSLQHFAYDRLQADPRFAGLISSVSTSAIWDDHDFATDNSWGGPDLYFPTWKPVVWRIFEQNWITPNDARPDGGPGVWQKMTIGNVDFFLLDSRYYRTDPKLPHPSMLGPNQEAWLLESLARSTATFKVIVSPVPWSVSATSSTDSWNGYPEERQRIFDWIRSQQIDGVVLVSSDRHRSDAWRIPQPDAYDLYEFESARLTNERPLEEAAEALFSYNKKPSFGLLTFDFSGADPAVRYSIVDIDNQTLFTIKVTHGQLTTPH